MKLDHTEEQQMIQAMAREFAETAIKPIAAEIDREARFPHETVKRMGELGLMGIAIPEKWGGSGADTVSYVVAVEEIAKACGSHADMMAACDPHAFAISSTATTYDTVSAPLPPHFSGIAMPMRPSSPMRFTVSWGKRASRSISAAMGLIAVSANSRAIAWIICCSSV